MTEGDQDAEDVPVGSVLPFGGLATDQQLVALGWMICDGRPLAIADYQPLYAAIGNCNGGDRKTYFNIPDYRGFFLRGVDPTGKRDPDAAARTAPAGGAACGARAGSIQGWATGMPRNKFVVNVPHNPRGNGPAVGGKSPLLAFLSSPAPNLPFPANAGGDTETRPANAYVNYIIKVTPGAALVVGSVLTYPGVNYTAPIRPWLDCGGGPMPVKSLPDLYAAIGNAYGGDGTMYGIPNFRGPFLRGVDNGAGRDPDSGARGQMAAGGNKGDTVGSVQGYATGRPINPFVVTAFLCQKQVLAYNISSGTLTASFNPGAVDVAVSQAGGDGESRPVFLSVNYRILYQAAPAPAQLYPVGGVIGIPGDQDPGFPWLLCDGSPKSANALQRLFNEIGYTYGGGGDTFHLPDYRGCFLRGAMRASGALGDWATGRPTSMRGTPPVTNDITASFTHLPQAGSGADWDGSYDNVARWDTEPSLAAFYNGDKETRPLNANINFYIKAYIMQSPAEETAAATATPSP
jgi:microcystin-dependent protein